MFRGGSYFEKRLISAAKIAKMKNHASVKYQVEVEQGYWRKIIDEERITDPEEAALRIKKEKENIRDFVAGVHNSGKAWITGYYIDPAGNEVRDIRVINIKFRILSYNNFAKNNFTRSFTNFCFSIVCHFAIALTNNNFILCSTDSHFQNNFRTRGFQLLLVQRINSAYIQL